MFKDRDSQAKDFETLWEKEAGYLPKLYESKTSEERY
jgi:hypothetical protein